MKASDYICHLITENKIEMVFGYIGGTITHLIDSIAKSDSIEMVNAITEQGAGFAAEGYSRATGKTGIAIATSGPGATNLITAIGSCYFDSSPTMFITGQVNTYEYKYDQPVRQVGFQETEIKKIVEPITKYSVLVDSVETLRFELEKGFFLAQHNRKGPVLLDIPMDIQRQDIDFKHQKSFYDSNEYKLLSVQQPDLSEVIDDLISSIELSERPIILAGGGVCVGGARDLFSDFIRKTNIPVVYSLMGKDSISDDYKYNLGLIGCYGNRYSNMALANSDLLIVLGSRLDSRQTGTDTKTFARSAKIFQIDIDPTELCRTLKHAIPVHADLKYFLSELNLCPLSHKKEGAWHKRLLEYKKKYPSTRSINKTEKVPNKIIEIISNNLKDNDIICVDVGQHQMWTAQTARVKTRQLYLFSGGMGAMGFAMPVAIGASLSSTRRCIVITGDGSMQMNIQELEVIKRRKIPVKIIIMNNSCLGMVRQFQELYFNKRYMSTVDDYSAPDFTRIADAYGLDSETINIKDGYDKHIKKFLSDDTPGVMNVILPQRMTEVEPKLIINHSIEDMYPFLSREELSDMMMIPTVKE